VTPVLVLVHGAFHRVSMWERLLGELSDVEVRTVQLPSSAPVPVPSLGDMYDDAEAVREAVRSAGGPVVVCAHSYGGVPTTEGLAGVDAAVSLIYLNAFLLDVGESMLGNRGGTYPPHRTVNENEGYVEMVDAENVFYNDLAPADAAKAAAALGPQSLRAMTQPLTRAAWHTVPSTYVIADRDAGLPSWMRERFAARAGSVRRMDTGHSPFLSQPAELARLLREELDAATRS
jgi:pimeloyl-ACP methyl ester carboxylesterase